MDYALFVLASAWKSKKMAAAAAKAASSAGADGATSKKQPPVVSTESAASDFPQTPANFGATPTPEAAAPAAGSVV